MVVDAVESKCEQERLINQLHRLDDREKWVLEMRFGLPGCNKKTQRDIARLLGISRSYVSRIEKKAVAKLSKNFSQEDGF